MSNHKERGQQKLQLHYWYVDEVQYEDRMYLRAHGIVSGHYRLEDATFINTSEVKNIILDKENGEVILKTRNSEYHCPMEYCKWDQQEKTPELISEYDWIKSNYKEKRKVPTIEEGQVLLVISNFDEYYFNSLYFKPFADKDKLSYRGYPHVGMFQDSYLVLSDDASIDIRYFPHYQNIEFYREDTNGKLLFVENIGDITLYVRSARGVFKLNPGDRKEIAEKNAEEQAPILPNGDLYPASFIDF